MSRISTSRVSEQRLGDETFLFLSLSINSHANPAHSSIDGALIDTSVLPDSFSQAGDSSSLRSSITFEGRESGSSTTALTSDSIRVINLLEGITSHSNGSNSWVYNERTSLELLDFDLTWDDDEVSWFTNWFQEIRILGSEDGIGIMANIVDGAKEPSATVYLQFDSTGNGTVDEESDPVDLYQSDRVKQFTGIPMDESGYYRLKITNYSGYNSLYSLDVGFTH